MSNRANSYPQTLNCPLCNEIINDYECIENQAVANDEIIEKSLPVRFKQKENWRNICLNCKYFETGE